MIRKAQLEDAEAIARIHVASWRVAYTGIISSEFLSALSEAERLRGWRQRLADGQTVILVAQEAGSTVGWVSGGRSRDEDGNDVSEVYAIYLQAEYWRRGIGRKLMAEMEGLLPRCTSITLWVLAENLGAIRFYDKIGYSPDGAEKSIQLGGQTFTEVRLRKRHHSP